MQNQHDSDNVSSGGELGILEAAENLFAEKGFDAVSMSAIARLANTSKANIYHHFKNKNDLYLAIMKAAVERSSALLDAIEHASGTYSQRLNDFASGQLDNILSHRRSMQLVLREALSGGSERGREIANYAMAKVFSRLAAMVSQGQQQGEFRKELDPTLAAFMIVSANTFYFQSQPVMQYLPEVNFADNPGSFSQSIMDIFFNGTLQHGGSGQ
jgi:TetR/AcrR family transcriptional regulator